jgi:hypothetical protein
MFFCLIFVLNDGLDRMQLKNSVLINNNLEKRQSVFVHRKYFYKNSAYFENLYMKMKNVL